MLGIAQILEGMVIGLGADYFGDLVYKGALQGGDPTLTKQLEVYDSLQVVLGAGITNLTITAATNAGPGPADLVLRLISAPKGTRGSALGWSVVDLRLRAGTLGTVYLDHVTSVATRTRTDLGSLMGRAMAHEIGHLLLGTSRHSADGLMRARWLDLEVRRDLASDWVWSAAEVLEMGGRLGARRQTPAATLVIADEADDVRLTEQTPRADVKVSRLGSAFTCVKHMKIGSGT